MWAKAFSGYNDLILVNEAIVLDIVAGGGETELTGMRCYIEAFGKRKDDLWKID